MDRRGLGALELMLAPKQVDADGSYADWFRIARGASEAATEMKAVLVADKFAYVPFSLSTLSLATAPAQVVLANRLTQVDAQVLLAHLQQ